MATKKQEAATDASAQAVPALALCAGSFDGTRRIPAGAIVEGVPANVLSDHAGWLDAAPAAVEHARSRGAPVLSFEAA